MRYWVSAALAFVLSSGVLPTVVGFNESLQPAIQLMEVDGVDSKMSQTLMDLAQKKNEAGRHSLHTAQHLSANPKIDFGGKLSGHQLDLHSAEALIQAPRLATIARRPRRPLVDGSSARRTQVSLETWTDEAGHEHLRQSASDLETSAALPLTPATISGKTRLAGMAACLAFVFCIFTFWL
ncbi:hypothetical protein MN608_01342 [Microdochium nivale]|nr:hypothetical protein MN608_01342 [Microdochium nivale]